MPILYGEQTNKALVNFPFDYHPVNLSLIKAITVIKKAAALANQADGGLTHEQAEAIVTACDEILADKHDQQFVTCAIQGGAGTSINMNVNEVIASLATNGNKSSSSQVIHPLDHVNKSQSTNDVNPSALRLVCLQELPKLYAAVDVCHAICLEKSSQWHEVLSLGRTHLQDAVPIRLGDEFAAYAAIFRRHADRLQQLTGMFLELNLGGTAIGNGINASDRYREVVYQELSRLTKQPVRPLANLMAGTSSATDFVFLMQHIVGLFVDTSKIANDIRLLVSGPAGGFAELSLPKQQNGSTIMPGKVNPVIPETINQLYFLFSGSCRTVESAAEAAQLQLGVMFPVIADCVISTLVLATQGLTSFANQCLHQLEVNEAIIEEHLLASAAFATLLTPLLGYDTVASVVDEAKSNHQTVLTILKQKGLYTDDVKALLKKV